MIETLDAPTFKVKPRPVQMVKPLGDRLIVLPDPPEEMLTETLIAPDISKERPARGTVIATGPLVSVVKVGDKVLYGHFTGAEMLHNGAEHLCLREDDLFCTAEVVNQ